MSHEDVAATIRQHDGYLIPYLLGWAGQGDPQPWGAAHGFALEVAHGYRLIKGESDTTLTERGKNVVAALMESK